MITIRKAKEEDLVSLEILFQLTRQKTFTSVDPDEFKIDDYKKSVEGEEVWIAEVHEKIVGFVSLWLPDNFVHNLFIHPYWQGKGIGSLLLKKAEERLSFPIELKVTINNFKACLFYEKHGWQKISIGNNGLEEYILYRKCKHFTGAV